MGVRAEQRRVSCPGLYNDDDSTKLKPAMEHFFLLQYKQHTTVFAPHTHVDGKTFSSFVTQVMVPIFDYYLGLWVMDPTIANV